MSKPCIFCKDATDPFQSQDHIVPESLGNTKNILPKGVVCDRCNNYFASKVEKPLLELASVEALRNYRVIPIKKGRIPPTTADLGSSLDSEPEFSATLFRYHRGPLVASLAIEPEHIRRVLGGGPMYISVSMGEIPRNSPLTSRFLAKMALEAFFQRVMSVPDSQIRLVEDAQFDPIRNHARRGQPREWPYTVRHIYDADDPNRVHAHPTEQVVYEYDLLWTPLGELYFVWAYFGWEFTINIGHPSTEGYQDWLKVNNDVSPLYLDKNLDWRRIS